MHDGSGGAFGEVLARPESCDCSVYCRGKTGQSGRAVSEQQSRCNYDSMWFRWLVGYCCFPHSGVPRRARVSEQEGLLIPRGVARTCICANPSVGWKGRRSMPFWTGLVACPGASRHCDGVLGACSLPMPACDPRCPMQREIGQSATRPDQARSSRHTWYGLATRLPRKHAFAR